MRKSFKNIVAAILIVAVITAIAVYFSGGLESLQGNLRNVTMQQNLKIDRPTVNDEIDPSRLFVSGLKQYNNPEVSSESQVLEFTVKSFGGFTVRYIPLVVNGDLDFQTMDPADWRAYSYKDGEIDYSQKICEGESTSIISESSAIVKLRCSDPQNPEFGYSAYEVRLAVTSKLASPWWSVYLKNGGRVDVNLDDLKKGGNLSGFARGLKKTPWMFVEDKFIGSDFSYDDLSILSE
ncbi:hypothetical protein KKC94_03845 [Patescibacteria group bacterium]|nr:hypothetical protein [Patescibacteria group bacterium]